MATLPEKAEWPDGIYQIETSDPVVGGPGGVSNRQAEQLASRTAFLKKGVESTEESLQTHTKAADPHTQYAKKDSPTFSGTPSAPTPAPGVNSAQIATTAYVMAAIAALVNGSPGALDTLKELASALGDDPNFSTTVLNKLAQKLEKTQNGADIPDKAQFMANLGLKEAAQRAVGTGNSDVPDISVADARYLGKTAIALSASKLASARKIAGVAFDGTADITLTPANVGALPISGGTLTGNLVSSAADAFRLIYGGYGAILRNDGKYLYVLLTNKDDASGGYNSLRPLKIDLATGNVELGHVVNTGLLQENGQRVYSPSNKPVAADIGALPADGTAAAATKLSLARKINGVAFDGTADITVSAAANGGTATTTTGNAGTATKLATARTINGVAFDGTANITITAAANGGTATTTTGNAGTATKLATARKINGVAFDGTADINLTPQNLGLVEIVETGSGTGYYWRKFADGKVEIFGRFATTYGARPDIVFPVAFASTPFIVIKENGSIDSAFVIRMQNLSKTGFSIFWNTFGGGGSGAAIEVCYHAIG